MMISTTTKDNTMELLAPAGTMAVFEAAVRAGADAVYVGAPGLNARNLAKDLTLDEIAAMQLHARDSGAKLYIAMNSLMREEEIPRAVDLLARFETMAVDAVIVQDLGILCLARTYFPRLRLHASTLLGAHNAPAVSQFATLGFTRVVLARELSLREIVSIHRQCDVEIEVFVHGALCFSYSGLCLFSSYLGGKSSMRGRCVQPCRRLYRSGGSGRGRGKKVGRAKSGGGGYLFSMNDLCGIDLLPQLRDAGVTSLKIEGRLRSVQYVTQVVRAYRTALDGLGADGNAWPDALAASKEMLQQAMGRQSTSGYFQAPLTSEIISPHHSGNIGLFLGRVTKLTGKHQAQLTLRQEVAVGDRLRLHQEQAGERIAFTMKEMRRQQDPVTTAAVGDIVAMTIPGTPRIGDSVYKVDTRDRRLHETLDSPALLAKSGVSASSLARIRERIKTVMAALDRVGPVSPDGRSSKRSSRRGRRPVSLHNMQVWVKSDHPRMLKYDLPLLPDRCVIILSRASLAVFSRMRRIAAAVEQRLVWSLPPVILQQDVAFFVKAIGQLVRQGFRTWQIGHVGQLPLFPRGQRLSLISDYTLNVANSQTVALLRSLHINQVQMTIEADKALVGALAGNNSGLGLTVYGAPPLFTARLSGGHLKTGRSFVSPKGEKGALKEAWGVTLALPRRPFSLLPMLPELAEAGVEYVVLDFCHLSSQREVTAILETLLATKIRSERLPTFNYQGTFF